MSSSLQKEKKREEIDKRGQIGPANKLATNTAMLMASNQMWHEMKNIVLCHLITSLAAHLVTPESGETNRPRASQEVEVEGSIETPESLRSLETVNYFPRKHLLSDYSEGQLDRNFSLSPTSSQFSPSSLSTGRIQQNSFHCVYKLFYDSEPDQEYVWLEEDTYEDDVEEEEEENVFNRHDFERRDLSVVYEEMEEMEEVEEVEEMEESDEETLSDVEQVVTGVCTIELDKGINIQTIVRPVKEEPQSLPLPPISSSQPPPSTKRVTFSEEFPVIINNSDNIKQTPIKGDQLSGNPGEIKCLKCKTKQIFNVRMSLLLAHTDQDKEKKSIFDFVVGWFKKFM